MTLSGVKGHSFTHYHLPTMMSYRTAMFKKTCFSFSLVKMSCLHHWTPTSQQVFVVYLSAIRRRQALSGRICIILDSSLLHRYLYLREISSNKTRCRYWPAMITRLEDSLRPNIGFTLRGSLAVFTRSTITPPKVNRFGWNLKHSDHILGAGPGRFLAQSVQ